MKNTQMIGCEIKMLSSHHFNKNVTFEHTNILLEKIHAVKIEKKAKNCKRFLKCKGLAILISKDLP